MCWVVGWGGVLGCWFMLPGEVRRASLAVSHFWPLLSPLQMPLPLPVVAERPRSLLQPRPAQSQPTAHLTSSRLALLPLSLSAGETRTAVVAGVRHCFQDTPHPVDALLPGVLPDFLAGMGDEDRWVDGQRRCDCARYLRACWEGKERRAGGDGISQFEKAAAPIAVDKGTRHLTPSPASLPASLPPRPAPLIARRHVRRAAVQVLSTAAHTKPGLVVEHLPAALPLLYAQTVVNKELIRTVDLGPFKHQIDDGLELRKVGWWGDGAIRWGQAGVTRVLSGCLATHWCGASPSPPTMPLLPACCISSHCTFHSLAPSLPGPPLPPPLSLFPGRL